MADADAKIAGSIDVLIDYKKGGLTLEQAVDRFRKLTGLTPDVAEKFIRGRNDLAPRSGDRRGDRQDRDTDSVGVSNARRLPPISLSNSLGQHANESGGDMHQDGDET